MRALLLVSHGSRRQNSNEEVVLLCEKLKKLISDEFDFVESAYLEIASPSIPEGIEKSIECGATSVVVLPYFLAAGRHVADDIPSIVNDARKKYPGISFQIARHVGASDGMVRLLADTVELEAIPDGVAS